MEEFVLGMPELRVASRCPLNKNRGVHELDTYVMLLGYVSQWNSSQNYVRDHTASKQQLPQVLPIKNDIIDSGH